MNVIRLENARGPTRGRGGKRGRNRDETIVTSNQVTSILPKYDFMRERQPLVNLVPSSTSCTVTPKNRKYYCTTSSSSVRRSASRRGCQVSGGQSSHRTLSSDPEHCIILAITSGRGDARSEVGIAAIDVLYPHMILSQISDCNSYIHTLTRINVLDPVEIVMPDTMCERSIFGNNLYLAIREKFDSIPITSIPRIHFHDNSGMDRIRTHCAEEFSTIELFVKQKYYALAAAAAVFKYVEFIQHVVYAPKSMRIDFQVSQNTTMIDIDSAQSLELVTSEDGSGKSSLLGVLDRCSTPMGRRLIRASMLQPPCDVELIKNRQECVTEFVSNRSFQFITKPVIKRLYGASRLLSLAMMTSQADNVPAAEKNLNYVLLLKNIIDVIPELRTIMESGQAVFFRKVVKDLEDPRFELIKEKILKVVHPEAKSVMGYTSSNMQRCFSIRSGLNDILDIARQTYCEIIDDMQKVVEKLSESHNLQLSLGCSANLGYHIEMKVTRPGDFKTFKIPEELIEIDREKNKIHMTTEYFLVMDQHCRNACDELHVMSNLMLNETLTEVREQIGCLLILSDNIGELDLLLSMAQISSMNDYTLPEFGRDLDLRESRHPVMDITGTDSPIPNDVTASTFYNFHTITGPNMSGKSSYLKQIVLLQIMAQLGCYVPAKTARFRIADRIFCKMCKREDIETNASTFTLEIRESQYITQSITPTSLVILDELCQGTTVEEGTSLAWAICERLIRTTAFTFNATHFFFLTRLSEIYHNVKNHYLNTESSILEGTDPRLIYTHKLRPGVAPIWNYGIGLAGSTGLPETIVTRAKMYAKEIAMTMKPPESENQTTNYTKTFYDCFTEMADLFNRDQFTVYNVISLVNKYKIPGLMKGFKNSGDFQKLVAEKNDSTPVYSKIVERRIESSSLSKRELTTSFTSDSDTKKPKFEVRKVKSIEAVSTPRNHLKDQSKMSGSYEFKQPTKQTRLLSHRSPSSLARSWNDRPNQQSNLDKSPKLAVVSRELSQKDSMSHKESRNTVEQDHFLTVFENRASNNPPSARMEISSEINDGILFEAITCDCSSQEETSESMSPRAYGTLSETSEISSESTYEARKRVRELEAEIFKEIDGSAFNETGFFESLNPPENMDCDE